MLLSILGKIVNGVQRTDDVKPQGDVSWLHGDHADNFRHSVAFHDGEVIEGLIESQRNEGWRWFLNPFNVEACCRRLLGPAVVNCFDLLGMGGQRGHFSTLLWAKISPLFCFQNGP